MSDVSGDVSGASAAEGSASFTPAVDQANQGPAGTPITEAQESARKRLAFFLTYIFLAEVFFAMTGMATVSMGLQMRFG